MLFDLATVTPQRQRVVADITTYEPKWSEEQIATEIEKQNELFPDMRRLPESEQQDRTNAVARSHSGVRIRHVQEWYSGNLYRLDQTDEGLVSQRYLTNHLGTYRNTFVDLDDASLSPYRSFRVDHQLRDIQLSKTRLYAKNDLWRALGLEGEMAFPLLLALVDSTSFLQGRPTTDADLGVLKLDPAKAERIHNGSDPVWRLEKIVELAHENQTQFILRGKAVSPIKPNVVSDLEYVYVIRRVGQRPVCREASLTNYTTHVSFISKRDNFDGQGFPHVWKRATIIPGSPTEQIDVVFKEVELNATFNDGQVFLPVFATNYIVSDVTSGKSVILKNPLHSVKINQPATNPNSVKRLIILLALSAITIFFLGIVLLHYKGNKPHEKV
jgi:hypothetical protein